MASKLIVHKARINGVSVKIVELNENYSKH